MDQARSQWAAGELLLWLPSGQPSLLSRDLTCPSSSSPASGVYSQHFSGKRKDQAYQNQGGCSTLSWCYKNSQYHTEPKGKENFSGINVGRGEETDPTLFSTVPGICKNPLVSILGAQLAETWCSNQGLCDPRCRVWGGGVALETTCVPECQVWRLCRSHPIRVGQEPVSRDPISALYLQCLVPSEIPNLWIESVAWLTCGPFLLSPCHIHLRSGPLSESLLCVLLSENLWWCHIHFIAYHISNT